MAEELGGLLESLAALREVAGVFVARNPVHQYLRVLPLHLLLRLLQVNYTFLEKSFL